MTDHSTAPANTWPAAWQPIATAPKDGRKILVSYLDRGNNDQIVIACWLTDDQAAETDTDGVGLECGWYECIDNWPDYTEVAIREGEPAHWMPLPPNPPATLRPEVSKPGRERYFWAVEA